MLDIEFSDFKKRAGPLKDRKRAGNFIAQKITKIINDEPEFQGFLNREQKLAAFFLKAASLTGMTAKKHSPASLERDSSSINFEQWHSDISKGTAGVNLIYSCWHAFHLIEPLHYADELDEEILGRRLFTDEEYNRKKTENIEPQLETLTPVSKGKKDPPIEADIAEQPDGAPSNETSLEGVDTARDKKGSKPDQKLPKSAHVFLHNARHRLASVIGIKKYRRYAAFAFAASFLAIGASLYSGWPSQISNPILLMSARILIGIPENFGPNYEMIYPSEPPSGVAKGLHGSGIGLLEELHNRGHEPATVLLASIYVNGYNVPRNYARSRRIVDEAKDPSYFPLRELKANFLKQGIEIDPDPEAAYREYEQLLQDGYRPAALALGDSRLSGIGVDQDPERAFYFFSQAREEGIGAASAGLGRIVRDELWADIPNGVLSAEAYFKEGMARGSTVAAVDLARLYRDTDRVSEAVEVYQNEARAHSVAASDLAILYFEGRINSKGREDAILLLSEAEAAGDLFSGAKLYSYFSEYPELTENPKAELARLRREIWEGHDEYALDDLADQIWMARNENRYLEVAAKLYEKAVTLGHAEAAYWLGRLHFYGQLEHSDREFGFRMLEVGNARGSSLAQFELGRIYLDDSSEPIDLARGVRELRNAAQRKDNAWVMRSYADILLDGELLAGDLVEALSWYEDGFERFQDVHSACSAAQLMLENQPLPDKIKARKLFSAAIEGGSHNCLHFGRWNLERIASIGLNAEWLLSKETSYHDSMDISLVRAFDELHRYVASDHYLRASGLETIDEFHSWHRQCGFGCGPVPNVAGNTPNQENYVRLLTIAAQNNSSDALYELGLIQSYQENTGYNESRGLVVNDQLINAFRYLERSASHGNRYAIRELDNQAANGIYSKEFADISWFNTLRQTADITGDWRLASILGSIYADGLALIDKNIGKALSYLEKSAEQSDLSKIRLALILASGEIVDRDIRRANSLLGNVADSQLQAFGYAATKFIIVNDPVYETAEPTDGFDDLMAKSKAIVEQQQICIVDDRLSNCLDDSGETEIQAEVEHEFSRWQQVAKNLRAISFRRE